MTRFLSLAHLTAIDLPPPELIDAAARAGFDAVGLRLIRVTETSPGYPLMQDTRMMRATKDALQHTGLTVNDIEFVKIQPETDVESLSAFLDAGAELGAREVICAPYDPDLSRLADTLAALSERAAARGLGVSLEFFPWTPVPDLGSAYRVVRRAGPDIAILVDALHFDRSASTLDQLHDIPADRLRVAHLCDAPVLSSYSTDDLLHTAREARLPPGAGQIDLPGLLRVLPQDLPLGIEVPMARSAPVANVDSRLSSLINATRRLLRAIPASGAN
ncbi:sugar phosphate isomerase/epimerase family protein [Tropicimonas marinistellae]|uniref:sugar phosphate isomerase/epimerase family protein n=1 Tax=Tropicimonas marinistellae TaxID=1739787 RepID=UPI000834B815|nr:sugar phosphate isomerase/epimerase [Tropicimonas marinistellae]